ncbi:conserved Plasmodium protein, unknown function [Plasmodium sp. DRC-Itaito]|nr:conserved Plasmodium protein, unknown function [Plasmodium sp. DRC-Itaito]
MNLINLYNYNNITVEYKTLVKEKKQNKEKEIQAAILIQKCFRGFVVRKKYLIFKYYIKYMQNQIQMLSCKFLLKKMKKAKSEEQAILYLSDNATKIQKIFRGYYSRKYIHDYFKRKMQILEMDNYVKEQRNNMMLGLEERKKKQLQYDNTMRDKKIHQVAKNLHHLVSTKTQKGVYNLKIENIIKEQQKKIKRKDKNYHKK